MHAGSADRPPCSQGGSGIIDNTNGLEQYFLPLVMSH